MSQQQGHCLVSHLDLVQFWPTISGDSANSCCQMTEDSSRGDTKPAAAFNWRQRPEKHPLRQIQPRLCPDPAADQLIIKSWGAWQVSPFCCLGS